MKFDLDKEREELIQSLGSNSDQPQRIPRELKGGSIISYAERKIDHSKNLIGNRWLSRGCGGFVVAPSGHGKSTFVIQSTICWACGRIEFALKPQQGLKILIVQAEDDENDMIEMAQMCDRLKLSEAEKKLLARNTHIEWLNDVAGANFFPVLDDFLSQFSADLVVINPYTAYQSDIKDDKLNNEFLRVCLSPLIARHNCGALVIHHTPKTNYQDTDKFEWFDWMYSMAGGASLTNWARGVLVIAPSTTPGTYRFIAAKRFEKTGWLNREYWFAHSTEDDVMLWVPASGDQIASAQKSARSGIDFVWGLIPNLDPISQEELLGKCFGKVGRDRVREIVTTLIDKGHVYRWRIPRPGVKSGVGYCQREQPKTEEDQKVVKGEFS
jgi:hypothetical protein